MQEISGLRTGAFYSNDERRLAKDHNYLEEFATDQIMPRMHEKESVAKINKPDL